MREFIHTAAFWAACLVLLALALLGKMAVKLVLAAVIKSAVRTALAYTM